MTMTIHFEMLTPLELSVLLWLLKPENLVPHSERGKGLVGYLHLGMGSLWDTVHLKWRRQSCGFKLGSN